MFIFVGGGGGGVESRPVDVGGGESAKRSFYGQKWAQNGVILVGLGLKRIYV